MNTEFSTLTLQDLETLITKGSCLCHIINPNKTRIILWKSKDNPNTYYLRIGIQKFISYPLTDKNSEIYWRFNSWEVKEISHPNSTNPDPITKFHQRQAKTEAINHGKSNSVSDHPQQSESTSQ